MRVTAAKTVQDHLEREGSTTRSGKPSFTEANPRGTVNANAPWGDSSKRSFTGLDEGAMATFKAS